jgi:uncharacterized protein YlxW (UPF0749 family)
VSRTHPGCDATCPNYCLHEDADQHAELLRQLSEAQAENEKLKARVEEESQNYVDMMELRDAEIRKVSQAQAEIQAMEHVVGALKDIAGRKLYPGVAEQMRDDAKEALAELDKVREGK